MWLCDKVRRLLRISSSAVTVSWRPGMPDYFEHNFQQYRTHIDAARNTFAIQSALELLESFRNWSPTNYAAEHKGTPFYVMGYAAFASHDYATASLLFDAAVAEDIRRDGPTADKPALLFIRLEDKNQEVLASQIIKEIIASVDELLNDYRSRAGARPINLDELRTHFIKPILSSPDERKRTLITAFISFIAEWKYRERLIDLIEHGSREPFFLHFYRGCLLFESLVKEKLTPPLPPDRNTLGPALQQMHSQLQIPRDLVLRCSDFDAEIGRLTGGMSVTTAIEMTGRVRNTLGHDLAWPSTSLDKARYDLVVKNIAAACVHVISTLYR